MGFLLEEIHGTTANFLYAVLVQIHELPELLLHAISSSCHLCFLLSLSVIWFGQQCNSIKHSQPRGENNRFLYYNIALFTSMNLVLFHISFCILGYFWYHSNDQHLFVEVGLATRAVTWFVLTAYLLTGFRKSSEDRFPAFLRIWWVVYLILSCSGLVVGILYPTKKEFLSIDQLVFHFCSVFAGLIFNYAGYFGKRVVHETIHGEPLLSGGNVNGFSDVNETNPASSSQYEKARILSILSFSWISPLLSVGHGKALNFRDVPQLATEDDVRTIFSIFRSILESNARVSPNRTITSWTLAKALILSSSSQLLLGSFCALMATMASFVGPFLIDYFVQYLSGDLKFANQGYLLVLGFILSKLVEGLCNVQYYFRIRQVGMRLKAPLVAMIYQKGLTLSSCSRQKHTSGEIINYMNIDAPGICSSLWPLLNLLLVPVKVMLALLILYPKIGLASLIALVTTLILMLANFPLAKLQQNYSKKIMHSKDSRMKATSEILKNMRILKLQAWEIKFLSKIMEMRRNETNWLLKSSYSSFAVKFLFSCSSIFVGVVTFGACMLMGISLRTGKVLTALAIFRDLQNPIYSIPGFISELVQTKVSLGRVSAFLCLEDLQPNVVQKLPKGSSEVAIEIKHCNFSWDSSLENLTLRDLNFSALPGMKVAVCGSVGSGKSSLLSCILGEVPKISGTINLCGKVAYVSQSPWILSGSIQDNITFGNKMDANNYDRVLDVCSLKKDLEAMPFGDQTIIGERGINLSGGQKQRVQIARAIYHDADIYLFDDPFSAVDAHTGSHLFKVTDSLLFVFLPASHAIEKARARVHIRNRAFRVCNALPCSDLNDTNVHLY